MAKVPLQQLASGYYSTQLLNNNFSAIQAAFEDTLSRSGTAPNALLADLDSNGKKIYNVDKLYANDVVIGGTTSVATLVVDAASVHTDALSAAASASAANSSAVSAAGSLSSILADVATTSANAAAALTSQQAALASQTQAATSATSASTSATTASSQAAIATNAASSALTGVAPVQSAQAQTNALLGLGIGSSTIDANGHLIMGYNAATITSVQIDAVTGHLTVTY